MEEKGEEIIGMFPVEDSEEVKNEEENEDESENEDNSDEEINQNRNWGNDTLRDY